MKSEEYELIELIKKLEKKVEDLKLEKTSIPIQIKKRSMPNQMWHGPGVSPFSPPKF
jgi:hypothetical protein